MRAIIDHETGAWLGLEGEDGTPVLDEKLHDLIDVVPGWPEFSRWRPDGAQGRGFYPIEPARFYTFNAWVDLFAFEEQVAIVEATGNDPVAKLIYDRALSASGSIDPTDPRTLQGLGYLVSKGYVARATLDRIAAL